MTNVIVMGYGKLGKEIVAQTGWDYIDRDVQGFDFRFPETYMPYLGKYDVVVNCIANTNTYGNDELGFLNINFKAVCKLVEYCNLTGKKIVQISTDYIYAGSIPNATERDVPVHAPNWYSYSKLLADGYVSTMANDHLVIRTSFKPYPFPYPQAITTQKGNFDYTHVIANLIKQLIEKNASGIYNVGTETKTIYDLAIKTNKNVIPYNDLLHPTMPTDVTMDVSKMRNFLKEKE